MSGIVGVVHFDGSPVDRQLLAALTASMSSRGPDDLRVFCQGSIGLGQAKLATTYAARREVLPSSLDGEVWVVADARIDDRRNLRATLDGAGCAEVQDATDAELILHAYSVWGEDAAAHLLGDFAFAIWDGRRRRLFCARDHFGVKPFYYVAWPGGIAFSNSLSCLRGHPRVSAELDQRAVADFLLFEWNLDPETTTFADVRRLPPAHRLSWSAAGGAPQRYWQLPVSECQIEPEAGWVERFRSLLRVAVEDRLRTDRVAVLMSGGLDSTAVAATAHAAYRDRGQDSGVACYTCGYERLIEDREPDYARLVARGLDAPFHFHPIDDYRLAGGWGELPVPPEPANLVLEAFTCELDREIAGHSQVVLTGSGGDSILLASRDYFLQQLGRGRLGRVAGYLQGSLRRDRRLPPLGLATRWSRWRLRRSWRDGYPDWLDPELEARLDLEARWRWGQLERGPNRRHPTRHDAFRDLWDVTWSNDFERTAAGAGAAAMEHRHPLFDLRLVEYLLEVPPVPWCLDKRLLRDAMHGVLPESVRLRPKTPVSEVPVHPPDRPLSELWRELCRRAPQVTQYVRRSQVLDQLRHQESAFGAAPLSDPVYRPLSFAYWLTQTSGQPSIYNPPGDDRVEHIEIETVRPARLARPR